ncbi:MAG: hypothetical protein ACFFCH_06845 [Promethearchaeota archaeon]
MRIFNGNFVPGEMAGEKATKHTWFAAALLMLVPIFMLFLSLVLPNPVIGWLNIIFAIILLLVNLARLRSYLGYYDRLPIIVGVVFNILTIWFS